MIKYIFSLLLVSLFFYGCGYKTDPVYVSNTQKDTKK